MFISYFGQKIWAIKISFWSEQILNQQKIPPLASFFLVLFCLSLLIYVFFTKIAVLQSYIVFFLMFIYTKLI